MAQKNRTDLATALTTLINDNANKEVTAADVRSVLTDYADSNFNILEDALQLMTYDGTYATLAAKLSNLQTTLTPLMGSSDWFNIGAVAFSSTYASKGIVSSNSINGDKITLNLSSSISGRKLSANIHYSSGVVSEATQNDWNGFGIRVVNDTQIEFLIQETGGVDQDLRIEFLAFNI